MWFLGVLLLLQSVIFSEARFEGCDYSYKVKPNQKLQLNSPHYPKKYPSGSSCRYQLSTTALDYELFINCTINIPKGPSACSSERMYIATDGNKNMNGASQFCGSGVVSRTSDFRSLVMAYSSTSSSGSGIGGTFSCYIVARPKACDCGWSTKTRITGGTNAGLNEFPFMTALYSIRDKNVFCGASIINHYTMLTAAHCTKIYNNKSDIIAMVGDYDLSSNTESENAASYAISQIIDHPDYNPNGDVNDISILRTYYPIEWSRAVAPVCLNWDASNSYTYQDTEILGWGTTSYAGSRSSILKKATVSVTANADCAPYYSVLPSSAMCTYNQNKDSCQYDSGGPCIITTSREFQIGIISHGKPCGSGAPSVNTRLSEFLKFIIQNSVGDFCKKVM